MLGGTEWANSCAQDTTLPSYTLPATCVSVCLCQVASVLSDSLRPHGL